MRQKIEGDKNYNVEAGRVIRNSSDVVKAINAAAQEVHASAPPVKETATQPASTGPVLSRLVQMTRRKDRLTVAQFAEKIRVSAAEVEAIEKDPSYAPRPRTVHNLAEYVKVPPRTILSLMPNAPRRDEVLNEAALKFAASSGDITDLSRQERDSLRDFVRFLSKYKGVDNKDV